MRQTNLKRYTQCGLAAAAAMASLQTVDAATIAWGSVTAFDDATDVLNAGTAVAAVGNLTSATTVINGVTFTDNNSLPDWTSAGHYGSAFFNGNGATGDAGFDDFTGGQFYEGGAGVTNTITLTGLTQGQEYQFQYIIMDGRGPGNYAGRTVVLGDGDGDNSNDSVAVARTNGANGDGNSITGTFIADATGSQTITITGSDPGMTGYVVRATPEPSSTALLGLGGLALILRRRK